MRATLGEPTVSKSERDALLSFLDEADAALAEFNAWQASGGVPGPDKPAMDAALAKLLSASTLASQVVSRMQSEAQSDWERLTWYEARAISDFSAAASELRGIAKTHASKALTPHEDAPLWLYILIGAAAIGGGLAYIGLSAQR